MRGPYFNLVSSELRTAASRQNHVHKKQYRILPLTAALTMVVLAGCAKGPIDLTIWLEATREHPWAPVVVIAVFVASGFVIAPLSAVMVPTILVFGPLEGGLWTLLGATASGAIFFQLGATGSALAARLGSRNLAIVDRLKGSLIRRGILAVVMVRFLPLAPYPVVNLALGASPVRFSDFMIGNFLGLLPWVALYAAAGNRFRSLFFEPTFRSVGGAVLAVACIILASLVCARLAARFLHRRDPTDEQPDV